MKAIKMGSLVFTVILLFFFLGQVKPLSVDASIGQCSITIYSIKNSDGNYTSATGDCQSHVQGHFSGGTSRIIIDGVDVGPISSGTVLNISGKKQSNYSLSINTVYEKSEPEPVTKPEPKPEPKPTPKPKPVNKPQVKPPEIKKETKSEPQPDPTPTPKPKEEIEEISLLPPKENEEPNIDTEEIEVAEKPEEILVEEADEEPEIEVEEEKEEEVVYSIEQLIKMMEKKEIKGEVKDGKYFVVFKDDKGNQEVTKEEAIKLGIIEEEEKKEKEEKEEEEVPILAVEDLKDEKASDAKGDKGKMPFIISMLGLIVVLAGAFMYFIHWRKSVKK